MIPKPEKKKQPQPLFTDADFETIVSDGVQKKDSFPAATPSSGSPLFTDEDFADIKKNDGLGGFVTDGPIKLPSDSPLPSPEKETPSSFLSKDIDNYLQFKSTDQLPAWMPQSLAQTPSLTPEPEQKRQIKEEILTNPEKLSKYIDKRFSEITSEIDQYNQKRSEELDKIKVQGGDYFKEGNDYAEIGKLIKEKEDSLNALRNNAAMLSSAIRIQKYLPEPEKFNPEELGRDIVRDSSPDLEAKFKLAEKNGMTLPGIQRADLQRLGIDAMKSYISNYAMPSQADMDTATKRLAFIENQLASDPRNEKLKAERDTLQSSLSEANTIRNIGIQVDEYEKSFDEKNFELTWNRVKEKFGAFLHKRGDSGVFGHNPEKLLKYVDDPELGLSEAEKKVAKQYGIPLEGKLIGTDIPGSGLVRSFKNAVEQSATGAYNTMSKFLGDQFRKVGVDVGRTESEQAFDLLNAEVSGTRFSPVGENQRSKAILNALNEKEAAGETLTPEEKSRKIEIQKYVDIRDNWDKVYDLTGNMTGQVATIALASRGLGAMGGVFSKAASSLGAGAAGLTSAAAGTILRNELGGLFLSSYLVAKDNYDMQAIDLMPNENQAAQREAYSNLMTGFEAATELIFRDTKVLPSFTKSLSPVAAKSVARMINGEITREAARAEVNSWIKNYVRTAGKEFVTSVAENSTEEAAIDVLQGITNAAFGIEDFDVYKTGQKAINTFATTAIGSGVIGAMSGHNAYSRRNNQNSFLKSSIGNMAVNPAEYLAAVEDLQLSGEITQQEANDKIRIIKSANKFLGELPSKRQVEVVNANGDKVIEERGFDRPESISYILHRINEDNLNEKLQATTDPIDQAQLKKEIDNSVKIRKGIYDGSIGVTPDITPVTDNPKVAEETGILLAGNAKPVDLVGTPFSKQEATQEISLNEKEQAAIEGLQGKDFSNSPIKPYTDVIQNPDATVADKKEALKGLSDQLTAKGTEILVGEALGKEADLIYDLEYEPAQESEAIQAVTGNKEVQNPLLAAYKNKKIQEAEKFDKAASEKGISVVRPGAVASPQVVEKTPPSTGAGKRVSVILPEQNQAPDVVAPVSEEVAEVSRIIEEELAQNGITEKQQVRDLFKEELGSSYDEALVDQAFEIYENKIKNEQAGKRIQPANEGVAESVQSEESESKKQTPKKEVPRKTESGSEGRAETTTPVTSALEGGDDKDVTYSFVGERELAGESHIGLNKEEAINRVLTDLFGTVGIAKGYSSIDSEIDKNERWLMRPDNTPPYVKQSTIDKFEDEIEFLKELKAQGFKTIKEYAESKLVIEQKPSSKTNNNATEQQGRKMRPQSNQDKAKRASDSDMSKGNRSKLQDREAPKKERKKLKTIEDVDAELRDLFAMDKMIGINDFEYSREDENNGYDNITNISNDNLLGTLSEFIEGLTGQPPLGKTSSKYFYTGKHINGKEVVIRIGNHPHNPSNVRGDRYTFSILINNDSKSGVINGVNFTELSLRANSRNIEDALLKVREEIDFLKNDADAGMVSTDRMVNIPVGGKINTIEQYLEKARAVLSQLYPNATITTYDTAEEYYDKEGRPVGSAGVFHPQEQRLALNLELIAEHGAENTIFHEVIHPIVNEAILSKEGALDDVFEQLKSLKDIPGMNAVHEHIQAYAGRGINIQKVEGITEFLTQVADGRIDLANIPEKSSSKIIDLINKIFEALGIALRISTATDLKRLSEAIKESFDNADASAVSELIGRRKSDTGTSSLDAILPEEQEQRVRDIISRSEGIDQNQLKAKIKQYTGWSDSKIDGLFTKPQIPSAPSAAQLNLAFDDKSILNRLVSGSNLPQSIKDNISKKGLKYQPQKQAEARRMSAYIIDTYGIDVALQQAKANMYHGDVNSAIFATSLDSLYEQERNATTPQQKFDLANKYADIASDYQNAAEGSGRFISFIYDFYRKSPAGIVLSVQKQFQRQQDKWFQGRDQNAKEAFDSFINTVEGKEIFEEAVKEANKKQPRKRIFTDENEAKIRKFFSKLKINTKTTTGSYLVPPQIFNAAIDIIEAAVIAGNSIGKAIEAGIEYINNNHKSAWDVAGFKKDISSSFKNQNIQRVLTEEDKAKILKKWDKKLSGLDEDSKKKLLNKAFIELMELGALSYDRFKQMYAEAAGLPQMTPELSQKLGDLANAINAPDALKDDLAENPTPQKIKEYREAISEAETASRELNELIAKEKHWFNTFLTVMRLNLLGSVSLVGNITYNVAAAPVRFFANATHTAIDYALAGVQITSDKIFGTDLYKNRPLYNVFRIQGAYFRGFWYGTKKAVEQFITGVSNRDYFQKEVLQNIRPLYSSKRLYRALTGKEKLSLNAVLNSFIEAFPTGGWSANFIARALNLGDKPFRFAAEYAKAEELAIKKGLKGINREAFILFPDEDSAEVIQSHGEKITFQQKNVVTAALDSGGRAINNAIKNKGMAPKVLYGVARGLGYATQPFLNTPLNVANEFIHYAFPPLSLYQAGKAMVEGDSERAKEYVSKAVVGLSLQAAATQLIAAGLMVAGSDDDEAPKERRGIQEYHRQGQLNITGLKRWLSGGTSESQHGDIFVDVNYWGFMGMMLSAKASQYKKSSKEDIQQQNMVTDMVGMLPAALRTGITDGVFRGTGALLNAYSMGGRYTDYWLLGMLGTIEGSFLPNFLRSFSLATDKYKRDTRDITFTQEAFNELKNKMFLGTDLPVKRNIWGDKIESAPKDQNAYVYYMFGINKKNPVDTEKFGYPLYDYYTKTKDANVFPPLVYRTINNKKLNAVQYEKLVELIGSHRKQLVSAFINTPQFEEIKNSTAEGSKLPDVLKGIYKTGRDIGVSEFLNIYPEFQK